MQERRRRGNELPPPSSLFRAFLLLCLIEVGGFSLCVLMPFVEDVSVPQLSQQTVWVSIAVLIGVRTFPFVQFESLRCHWHGVYFYASSLSYYRVLVVVVGHVW